MLSQRARNLSESLMNHIESDKRTVESLNIECPNWKENIMFAMHQQNMEQLLEAIEAVRLKQEQMRREFERYTAVLAVYEDAMQKSLTRLSKEEVEHNELCLTPTS